MSKIVIYIFNFVESLLSPAPQVSMDTDLMILYGFLSGCLHDLDTVLVIHLPEPIFK